MPIGTEGNEEVVEVLGELRDGFTEFKAANEAKFEAMKIELKKFEAKANRERLGFGGSRMERTHDGGVSAMSSESKAALEHVFRGGDPREVKSGLTTVSGPGGGYLCPEPLANEIARIARPLTPMRSLAKVIPNASANLVLPIVTAGLGTAWRAEGATRSETTAPTFGAVKPQGAELSAVVRLTRELVQDAAFPLIEFVTEEAARAFAVAENRAFILGTGVSEPAGLAAQTMVEGAATWPKIGFVKSGSAASIADAAAGPGGIYDLISLLAPEFRVGAAFLASGAAIRELRGLEDSAGNALWAPSLAAGEPSMLCGLPLYESADVADPGAGAFPLWLGNWARAFVICDVGESTLIVNPYKEPGFVLVEIARRVKSAVLDSRAVVALKCAA